MRFASALALHSELDAAVADALSQISGVVSSSPDLVIAFVSAADGSAVERLPRLLAPWLADGLLIGCNAGGLIGGGDESEDDAGVAILAGRLGDATLTALHVEQAAVPPVGASREKGWRLLDRGPESGASFMMLADPASLDAQACARGIDRAYPGATVVGGLASGAQSQGESRFLVNDEVHGSGGLLLAFSGNVVIDPVVAQGCRAIGEPLFVTACDGNLVHELDGRRPRDLLTSLFSRLDGDDRARFGESLCIGLALPGPRQTVGAGDFLIRNVLGIDPDSGALWIGSRVAQNAIVQFHLRDGRSASQELESRLSESLAGQVTPAAALLFACVGRGRSLFGVTGHDSGTLRRMVDVR